MVSSRARGDGSELPSVICHNARNCAQDFQANEASRKPPLQGRSYQPRRRTSQRAATLCGVIACTEQGLWGMATNSASSGREPYALIARTQPHDEWH
jgi:hypothetical protein